MLTSQGILRNHYSLVFPAQLISDITKYKCKPSGKFKEKKRKQSRDSQSGSKTAKTKKEKRHREYSNEISESSSSESSVCETGHKTTETTEQQRRGLQGRKLGLPASTLMFKKPLRTSVTMNNSQRRRAPLPLYL